MPTLSYLEASIIDVLLQMGGWAWWALLEFQPLEGRDVERCSEFKAILVYMVNSR